MSFSGSSGPLAYRTAAFYYGDFAATRLTYSRGDAETGGFRAMSDRDPFHIWSGVAVKNDAVNALSAITVYMAGYDI